MSGPSVTSRVVALLSSFDADHRALPLGALARRAGLPLTTAHRLVAELVTGGFLDRYPHSAYVGGGRAWGLGLLAPAEAGLRDVASPFLHDIYAATRATVHLAGRDGDRALYG